MACPFCATGQAGLTRNLSTAEIVEQVGRRALRPRRGRRRGRPGQQRRLHGHGRAAGQLQPGDRRGAPDHRRRPPHGSGSASAASYGLDRRARRPRSRQLADEGLQVTLALSLHAPDDELRDTLCRSTPAGRSPRCSTPRWHYADVDRASGVDRVRPDPRRQRPAVAGRPARPTAARGGTLVHVNLIPLNPTPGSEWDASPKTGRARVRPAAARARASHAPSATPAAARSPAPAASSPPWTSTGARARPRRSVPRRP